MSRPEKLSSEALTRELASLKEWRLEDGAIERTFEFKSFKGSLLFVNAVGYLAEQMNHHPDIDIRYNKVRLALVTHDADGLTRLDFELAGKIDGLGGFGR